MSSRLERAGRALRATPFHPQWLLGRSNAAVELLSGLPGGRVLDVGCADRWIEARLPPGCEYIGMDYTVTGKHIYGARPDFFADAAGIPLPDGCMQAVLMLEVVEHLRFPREALHECARVLAPGGVLIASMPFMYPMHDEPHDYQRYTLHGWTRELDCVGLRLSRIEPRLRAVETAGLLASLAMAGGIRDAVRGKRWWQACALAPLGAVAIPVLNLLAWTVAKVWPSWAAMPSGYLLSATKP